MATVQQIKSDIDCLNPKFKECKLGQYIDRQDQSFAEGKYRDLCKMLPEGSLAKKILVGTALGDFSDKQLWAIAYELLNVPEYTTELDSYIAAAAQTDFRKTKIAELKEIEKAEAAKHIFEIIEKNGKKINAYLNFLKKNKQFAKEFYSKKYTETSAMAFIGA